MSACEQAFRPIAAAEKAILDRLLEANFPGRDELVGQVTGLQAKCVDAQGSLRLSPTTGVAAPISRGVAVEGKYADADTKGEAGAHVNILLHVADGKLSMIEIFKDDGSAILKAPNPTELRLFSRQK
jgi:hypothetical protein